MIALTADVGDPRSYKWINTVPLAKSKSASKVQSLTRSVGATERRGVLQNDPGLDSQCGRSENARDAVGVVHGYRL